MVVASMLIPATPVLVGGGPARAAGATAPDAANRRLRRATKTRDRRAELLITRTSTGSCWRRGDFDAACAGASGISSMELPLSSVSFQCGTASVQRGAWQRADPDDRPRGAAREAGSWRRLQADHGAQSVGIRRQAHPGVGPFRHPRGVVRRRSTGGRDRRLLFQHGLPLERRAVSGPCPTRLPERAPLLGRAARLGGCGPSARRRVRGRQMSSQHSSLTSLGPDHPYADAIEAERLGWYELITLVRALTPEECMEPGYYHDPDWAVRDVVAHLGTWLAEAEVQFERINAGTYEGHDVDIDGLNAAFLAAMANQPWQLAWVQANAGRTRMIQDWYALREPTDEAAWWIRKSGSEHYAEHVGRLREWVTELVARRPAE